MIKNQKLDQVNAKVMAYLTQAIKDFHKQNHGVRVISVESSADELNPPGLEYNFKIKAQVTFEPKENPPG